MSGVVAEPIVAPVRPLDGQDAEAWVLDFADISDADVGRVGGKNASLGALLRALSPEGVGVLDGFATTAGACSAACFSTNGTMCGCDAMLHLP